MQIEYDAQSKCWKVSIQGDLDITRVLALREPVLAQLETRPANVLVDASKLTYIDSTGLGALVSVRNRVIADGFQIKITGLAGHIKKLFVLTGLEEAFGLGEE